MGKDWAAGSVWKPHEMEEFPKKYGNKPQAEEHRLRSARPVRAMDPAEGGPRCQKSRSLNIYADNKPPGSAGLRAGMTAAEASGPQIAVVEASIRPSGPCLEPLSLRIDGCIALLSMMPCAEGAASEANPCPRRAPRAHRASRYLKRRLWVACRSWDSACRRYKKPVSGR